MVVAWHSLITEAAVLLHTRYMGKQQMGPETDITISISPDELKLNSLAFIRMQNTHAKCYEAWREGEERKKKDARMLQKVQVVSSLSGLAGLSS